MVLKDWVYQFLRRIPRQFTGQITFHCHRGGVTKIDRFDSYSEEQFYHRFQEERSEKHEVEDESADATEPTLRTTH